MSRSRQRDEPARVLTASVHDIKYFSTLLRGVHFTNRATVNITENGLTVTVEEARTLLGTAFIFRQVFDEYHYTPAVSPSSQNSSQADNEDGDNEESIPTNAAFVVGLNHFIECLNIFGTAGTSSAAGGSKLGRLKENEGSDEEAGGNEAGPSNRFRARDKQAADNSRIDEYFGSRKGTGMRMSYAGPGYPLTMLIAEDSNGPTAACEITTSEPEPHLELPFDDSNTVLRIILKSSWLREALSEIDSSCEKLVIIGNPPPPPGKASLSHPRLRLQAAGALGSTEMDYPNDREVLETCECEQAVSFSYRFSHISKSLKALNSSSKTSLRINEDGILSLQFLMPAHRSRGARNDANAFIEYRCLPLDEMT